MGIGVAHAQFEDGSLVGTIRDSSGAVIAGATVTATNTATGITGNTTTTNEGDYEFPSLRVGVYTITATAKGFAQAVAQNITISVGSRQHIDLKVVPGTTQTVEVSDVALQIETETSERGQTVSEYQTESLPLVSRNYSDLLALVTGSRQAPTEQTTTAVTSPVPASHLRILGILEKAPAIK